MRELDGGDGEDDRVEVVASRLGARARFFAFAVFALVCFFLPLVLQNGFLGAMV
jgi:hypothetical protein